MEEADEAVYWLELIAASAICRDSSLNPLLTESGELSAIFDQSQLTAKANAAAHAAARARRNS